MNHSHCKTSGVHKQVCSPQAPVQIPKPVITASMKVAILGQVPLMLTFNIHEACFLLRRWYFLKSVLKTNFKGGGVDRETETERNV